MALFVVPHHHQHYYQDTHVRFAAISPFIPENEPKDRDPDCREDPASTGSEFASSHHARNIRERDMGTARGHDSCT